MMRKKVDKFYTLVIGKIVMAVGAVMVLAIAVQIATRYIPGFSITWTDELARLMFVWYGFLGAALAVPKGVHLGSIISTASPGAGCASASTAW